MGFDFMAGALTGLLTELGTSDQPAVPHGVNVICDFLTGYLGTLGVQSALMRRATEGGSYRVTVTLTQTVMFELALGLVYNNTLLDLLNKHAPVKHKTITLRPAVPWINNNIKMLIRKRRAAERQWRNVQKVIPSSVNISGMSLRRHETTVESLWTYPKLSTTQKR